VGAASPSPCYVPALAGFVPIPPTGGHDHQNLNPAILPSLTTGTAVSDSSGSLGSSSTASSYAQAQSVCALPSASGCSVGAQLVRSVSNSSADAAGAS